MKNTGTTSQQIFDDYWKKFGKRAFVHEFFDSAKISGLNRRRILNVPKQPADRLVTFDGVTFYAEVKSTINKTSFAFSNIQPNQLGKSIEVTAAGGLYYFYIHNLNDNSWYRVPAQKIHEARAAGRQSLKWQDLKEFECSLT